MDWQMLGALGEIFGAIGVIATLGYLASQIRESRLASRQEAVGELMDQTSRFLGQLATSAEMARLWRLGMAADTTLSNDEVLQFRMLLMRMTYTWERLYHLGKTGQMDEWVLASNCVARRMIVGAAGFQAWFESRKELISPSFRELLEREIAESTDYNPGGLEAERPLHEEGALGPGAA